MDATRIQLDVLGTLVALSGPTAIVDRVRHAWQPFPEHAGTPAHSYEFAAGSTVRRDGSPIEAEAGVDQILRFATDLNQLVLAGTSCFAVHSGVVARNGRALAFPAASGTGKSTMTAACLRLGWEYVSDEALLLDFDDGLVRPYPRPLALSPWSAEAVGLQVPPGQTELLATAADLGAEVCTDRPALTDVVLLTRGKVASASLSPRHSAEAVQTLLSMSFNHYRWPADSVSMVGRVAQDVRVHVLLYDDPLAGAAALDDLPS